MSAELAEMAAALAAGCFKKVGEEDTTRLRGMLFGIIKQMQHLSSMPMCLKTLIYLFTIPQVNQSQVTFDLQQALADEGGKSKQIEMYL